MCRKMKLDLFIPHTGINSKWIKDLNVRPKTIKIIEEDIDTNLEHCLWQNLSNISPQAKEKINRRDYIHLKSCCTAKKIIHQTTTHRMGEHIY